MAALQETKIVSVCRAAIYGRRVRFNAAGTHARRLAASRCHGLPARDARLPSVSGWSAGRPAALRSPSLRSIRAAPDGSPLPGVMLRALRDGQLLTAPRKTPRACGATAFSSARLAVALLPGAPHFSLHPHAAVHRKHLAGDIGGPVGGQEGHGGGHVLRGAGAARRD